MALVVTTKIKLAMIAKGTISLALDYFFAVEF
jgi:hypothetical protein